MKAVMTCLAIHDGHVGVGIRRFLGVVGLVLEVLEVDPEAVTVVLQLVLEVVLAVLE